MSGGTLIAFAADEIVMDPYAVLGPVDPQLMEGNASYPAVSILKVLETKKIDQVDDQTIIIADEAKKAMSQNESLVRKILAARYPEQTVNKIVDELVSGKYTHDIPITADHALAMGMKVSTEVPGEIYDLMHLYKMGTTTKRPGVEFVPSRWRPAGKQTLPGCSAKLTAENKGDLIKQGMDHAKTHGMAAMAPDMMSKLQGAIKQT
jgi:ClpP class serine protease